jgi:hypothetical protein
VLAARKLGLQTVPTIVLTGLSETQKRALRLADNRIAQNSTWDEELVRIELQALSLDVSFDLNILGFAAAEIDVALSIGGVYSDEPLVGHLGDMPLGFGQAQQLAEQADRPLEAGRTDPQGDHPAAAGGDKAFPVGFGLADRLARSGERRRLNGPLPYHVWPWRWRGGGYPGFVAGVLDFGRQSLAGVGVNLDLASAAGPEFWQRLFCDGFAMGEFGPVATFWGGDVVAVAGLLEGCAGNAEFGGDLDHGLGPDALVQLFPRQQLHRQNLLT